MRRGGDLSGRGKRGSAGPAAFRSRAATLMAVAALLVAFLAETPPARPAEPMSASLQIQDEAIWDGQTTQVTLSIANPGDGIGAPELPPVDGLVVHGPSGPMQQQFIVNGRRSSQWAFTYRVSPAPGKTGAFRIGPARVPVRGAAALTTNAVELKVHKRPGVGIRFQATATPQGGPIGSPFRVVYTVYYTGETDDGDDDPFLSLRGSGTMGISGLNLPLLQLSGARVEPIQADPRREAYRLPLNDGSQLILQRGVAEEKDGTAWKTISMAFQVTPMTTGTIEIPAAAIAMKIRTGRVRVVRDFVFERQVPEVVEYKAQAEAVRYVVRELPREGRPQGYTGAVGRYTVAATASPTQVDAFAPITVEIRVGGQGLLGELKPAAWSEMDVLTKDFEVSTDVSPGEMDGKTKVFRQVIRAKNAEVKEIPPIPFPYYDPQTSRYEVAMSAPIPIQVRAVTTVSAEDSIPSVRSAPGGASGPSTPGDALVPSISRQSGIPANFRAIGAVGKPLDPRERVLELPFLATLLGAPAAFGALVLVRRLLRRDPRRIERARRLAGARRDLADPGLDLDRLCDAYQEWFRARLELPPGEITRRELSDALRSRGVPEGTADRAVAVLDRLSDGRFGGTKDASADLRRASLDAVREVDRCPLG